MKVIKEGHKNIAGQGWSEEHKCTGCGVMLLIEVSDLYQFRDLLCDTNEAMFECSECDCTTSIKVPDDLEIEQI
jgi:hypothetical protein